MELAHEQGLLLLQTLLLAHIGEHAQCTRDLPQLVTQGEATTDEMMLVYFAYMAYQPGDEDIVIDSSLLSTAVPWVPEPGAVASRGLEGIDDLHRSHLRRAGDRSSRKGARNEVQVSRVFA